MVKVGEKIAEFDVDREGGPRIYVIVGSIGELEFWSDSIGGGVRIWDTLSGDKQELLAIWEWIDKNKDHIPYEELEFPEEPEEEEFGEEMSF